jgi:hypothetical protein
MYILPGSGISSGEVFFKAWSESNKNTSDLAFTHAGNLEVWPLDGAGWYN